MPGARCRAGSRSTPCSADVGDDAAQHAALGGALDQLRRRPLRRALTGTCLGAGCFHNIPARAVPTIPIRMAMPGAVNGIIVIVPYKAGNPAGFYFPISWCARHQDIGTSHRLSASTDNQVSRTPARFDNASHRACVRGAARCNSCRHRSHKSRTHSHMGSNRRHSRDSRNRTRCRDQNHGGESRRNRRHD